MVWCYKRIHQGESYNVPWRLVNSIQFSRPYFLRTIWSFKSDLVSYITKHNYLLLTTNLKLN